MDVLSTIKDFQTAVTGVVGFTGVIVTLIVNDRRSRRQRREQIEHDRLTVRTALKEELRIIKASFDRGAQRLKAAEGDEGEGGAMLIPVDPMSDTYTAMIGKLGLLTPAQIEKVMNAYLLDRQFGGMLRLFQRHPPSPEIARDYVQISRDKFAAARNILTQTAKAAEEAIKALDES